MNPLQNLKVVNVTPPAAIVNTASFTTNVIDTLGYDTCRIMVSLGATDIAFTVAKVQESDTKASGTSLTNGADVTGLVFGTSTDISGATSALPSATDDNGVFIFDIDCRTRKRYLLPIITIGTGSTGGFCSCVAILARAEQAPTTAAGMGAKNVLSV